ncbi:MAG: hypothetical protein MK085_07075 [Phycisphaerales bacterium]|nr:hypothetical protein [Phycisphaerales bacterium]
MMGSFRSLVAVFAASMCVLAGCGRSSSHLDALPRPLGSADVLRFELAWGDQGLQLDQADWRGIESAIDDGQQRWRQWVRARWAPFIEDVWFRSSQPWKDDPDKVTSYSERARALRLEAARLDEETVARVLMFAGNDEALERFRAMRRMGRAGQLLNGYSSQRRVPEFPESSLARAGLSEEGWSRVRDGLAPTASVRAGLLEVVAARRFELDLIMTGEDSPERRAALTDGVARYREAMAALDKANTAAVNTAAQGLGLEDRARVDVRWLQSSADPDGDLRRLGDVAFEAVARGRRLRPAEARKVREMYAAWEASDLEILEQFADLQDRRWLTLRDRPARKALDSKIKALRNKRGKLFWEAFGELDGVAPTELVEEVGGLIRDLPDANALRSQLAGIAGRADADAIFDMVPQGLLPEPDNDDVDRLLDSEPMANLVADPISTALVRRLFRDAPGELFDVGMELHADYQQAYLALADEAQPRIDNFNDEIKEIGGSGSEKDPKEAMRKFGVAVYRMVDLVDSLRLGLDELDDRFFMDLAASAGPDLRDDLVPEQQRRQRHVHDVDIDDEGPFAVAIHAPPRVELAEVVELAGLDFAQLESAEQTLREFHPQLLDVRIRHRGDFLRVR